MPAIIKSIDQSNRNTVTVKGISMKHKVVQYVSKSLKKYLKEVSKDGDENKLTFLLNDTIDRTALAVLDDVGELRIQIGQFEGYFVKDMQGYKEIRARWDEKYRNANGRIYDLVGRGRQR